MLALAEKGIGDLMALQEEKVPEPRLLRPVVRQR